MIKLLIVDDDHNLLSYLSEELIDAGFEVRSLDNGADAIVLVTEEKFDLILLDMLMPGLDGIQVVKVLRRIAPQIPIIGMTGYVGRGYMSQAAELKLQILNKPVVFTELIKTIKQAVQK
jgi:CheY-like chemotaxis protein